MAVASYRSESDRGRIRGIVLALVVEGLIALLLLHLGGAALKRPERQPRLTTFDVRPVAPVGPKRVAETKVASKQQKRTTTASAAPPPPVAPPPVKSPVPSKLIQLSPDDYAASDIGKIPSAKGEGDGSDTGKDAVAAYGPGEGPGGATLYNAEWYREPTRAELAYYLPKNAETGWGLIACRTIPDYHVENCRSLGESPVGSGRGWRGRCARRRGSSACGRRGSAASR